MSEAARARLILELRQSGVHETKILAALERVPREDFVPAELVPLAWENRPLAIGCEQTISQPEVIARMTAALELEAKHRVLEIGTGSGYHTAVLAQLCRRVFTVERHRPLLTEARQRFARLGIEAISTKVSAGSLGWAEQAPFDRILVTAAAERLPEVLIDQLTDGGIMVIPIGPRGVQRLTRVTKNADGHGYACEDLVDVRFVPLIVDGEAV